MCGGIGSRFWPLSRTDRPKQFIDFFGTGSSLLQMTVERIRPVVPDENIVVVTNRLYADIIREQLPFLKESQILLEPARRNTAPCIAWAAYHIAVTDPQASMIVMPSERWKASPRTIARPPIHSINAHTRGLNTAHWFGIYSNVKSGRYASARETR